MGETESFYGWLKLYGLEYFGKYYGLYEGIVAGNADPEKRGRIQVRIPEIDPEQFAPDWFMPAFMQAGDGYGWFWPPEVGDRVLVCFRTGNPSYPGFYFGAWLAQGKVPPLLGYPSGDEVPPSRRGFVTKTGHALVLNEEADKEEIDLVWTKGSATSSIRLLPDGSISIVNKQQARITLDAAGKQIVVEDADNGNTITLDSSGVKIQTKGKVAVSGATEFSVDAPSIKLGSGATNSAVLGEALVSLFNGHTHPTGVGPSGTPLVPANASILSKTVKLK